jgi:hypothetical protein
VHKVRFRVVTQTPIELPSVVKVVSETLRASGCITLERPPWVLASCGDRVLVKVYIQVSKQVGEILGFEGASFIELESSNPQDMVKMASILAGAFEKVKFGIVMEE